MTTPNSRTLASTLSSMGDWFARRMPTHTQLEGNRYVPRSALRSELWRFTRRSVPRGVALGIVVGIMVPFAQIVFAAIFSLPVRANVPLAALMTFLTNPFTTPLLWAFSYQVGRWMLRADPAIVLGPYDALMQVHDIWSGLHWITDEGKYLVFGLLVVSAITGAVGYLLSGYIWRTTILRRRRRRLEQ